ncbi:HAD-IA family hydrolase, partial [Salmonella enterica subsp. enterica serovar Montevideo]|nr:HAD-IA family hydrolase [Salmonella enterica subsp. enterica serovar Montevideo]
GMRKPEARIYQHVLQKEGFSAADAVFFDDNADNIEGANQLGISSATEAIKAGRNIIVATENAAEVGLISKEGCFIADHLQTVC